jgi:signal transduction histidine kinase
VARGTVEVTTGSWAGRAVLMVSNTGPLIPPEEIGRLFQPFQRSGTDRTGCREGLGLGLSIVDAIARAHDAWLRASALAGGGLRVQAGFPQLTAEPLAGAPLATRVHTSAAAPPRTAASPSSQAR